MTNKTGLLLFPAFYIILFALFALPAALRLNRPQQNIDVEVIILLRFFVLTDGIACNLYAFLDINNLLEISKDAGLENTGIRCVCRMSKITIGAAIWLKHLKNGLIRTFRRCEISQLCGFPNIIFSVIQVG